MGKAIIFNIMRYSVHDGPGIRTTVFFKGCPLSCQWCHNPESLSIEPQQVFHPNKCIHCGNCDNCPTGARETIGYEITSEALMKEILKDLPFYDQSGGGVTFSGGEPLYQPEFLMEMLDLCKKEYIRTAVDTSGYCDEKTFMRVAEKADLFLYDVKFFDRDKHEKYCGVPNEIILKNLAALSKTRKKILIRIPVIPTVNDDLEEMTKIYHFIKDFKNVEMVHLLPYHNIQSEKYKRLEKEYLLSDLSSDESPNMAALAELFGASFRTKIGG